MAINIPSITRSWIGENSGFSFFDLKGIDVGFVLVTPELAETWLKDKNSRNRKFRKVKLANYVHDMENKEWMLNGESIIFSDRDILNDGQHRLQAVVESGEEQVFLVVWGTHERSQTTVDRGAGRQTRDDLIIAGMDSTTSAAVAAIAKQLILMSQTNQLSARTTQVTNPETLDFIYANLDALERAAEVYRGVRANNVKASPTGIGAAYFNAAKISQEHADIFIAAQLIEGIGLKPNDPAKALSSRFERYHRAMGRVMEAGETYCYVASTWNHFRQGHTLEKVQAPKDGYLTYPEMI